VNRWPKKPLGELANVLSGFAFESEKFGDTGDLPLVRIRDVVPGHSSTFYRGEYDPKYLVKDGEILIGMDGEFNCARWLGGKALLNQRVCRIAPLNGNLSDAYLFHFLPAALKTIEAATPYVTVKHLSVKDIHSIEIPLPPVEEQRRIAAILDKADELRKKRRATLAQLDSLIHAAFMDLFGNPIENPKRWKKERLGDIVHIRRGGSPRPIENFLGGTINWIKIGDATTAGDDIYLTQCRDKITEQGLKKTVFLKSGSLIFANCGVSLGFARILKIDGCIHDGWLSFEDIPEDRLEKLFLLKALNTVTDRFRKMAPDGTQPNLNTSLMKNFEMILPPIKIQHQFGAQVEALEGLKSAQRASLRKMEALFASLQHRAFWEEL
jgi:type I restriction enzyme S subunit